MMPSWSFVNDMRVHKATINREAQLLDPVAKYARKKGFSVQVPELPFFEYRIDLFGLSKPTGDTIAVELKIKNWRRALQQALIYQLCSDFVFIALPEGKASLVNTAELAKHGIGLIVVTWDLRCRTELAAVRSSEVRDHYRQEFAEFLVSVRL